MAQDAEAAGAPRDAAPTLHSAKAPAPDPKREMGPAPMPADIHREPEEALWRARQFEAAEHPSLRRRPADHSPSQVLAQAGETRVVSSLQRRHLAMAAPQLDTYEFGFRWQEAGAPPSDGKAPWGARFCMLSREGGDAGSPSAGGESGACFELPYKRTASILESLIDQPLRRQIEFAATLSLETAQGAAAARAAAFVEQELAIQGALPAPSLFGAALEELLIRALLVQLPHNYSALLQRGPRQAAPFNVKRAEAFMRAHAHEPLKIEQIAEVAGCSVRSLQSAFLRFVGCTPMQRLRRIRLELARGELQRADREHSVADLAAKYGFSNAGRFASHYRSAFGHPPSRSRSRA